MQKHACVLCPWAYARVCTFYPWAYASGFVNMYSVHSTCVCMCTLFMGTCLHGVHMYVCNVCVHVYLSDWLSAALHASAFYLFP